MITADSTLTADSFAATADGGGLAMLDAAALVITGFAPSLGLITDGQLLALVTIRPALDMTTIRIR